MTVLDRDPEVKCANCAFLDRMGPDCRRHAPQPDRYARLVQDDRYIREEIDEPFSRNIVMWPEVDPDHDWCGEFKLREPA